MLSEFQVERREAQQDASECRDDEHVDLVSYAQAFGPQKGDWFVKPYLVINIERGQPLRSEIEHEEELESEKGKLDDYLDP